MAQKNNSLEQDANHIENALQNGQMNTAKDLFKNFKDKVDEKIKDHRTIFKGIGVVAGIFALISADVVTDRANLIQENKELKKQNEMLQKTVIQSALQNSIFKNLEKTCRRTRSSSGNITYSRGPSPCEKDTNISQTKITFEINISKNPNKNM